MSEENVRCVLLADPHHGLSEGICGLLATTFEMVVMVADAVSLFESAHRLQSELPSWTLGCRGEMGWIWCADFACPFRT